MGQDAVWRLLLRFSLPAIISMTVASTYTLVDAIFIGMLGPEALAAMGVTFPLVLSLVAIASGTGVGVTSLITRRLGAGDREHADRVAGVAITLCFLIGSVVALAGLSRLDGLLRLLGASSSVLPLARDYMKILMIFNVFTNLAMILTHLVRADGNPLFASAVSISTAILNIVLDPIWIFGLGPVPAMGIEGAAIATVIAQATGISAHIVYLAAGRSGYRFTAAGFVPQLEILAGIYRVGIASIVRSGAQFVVMGVINTTAAAFGVIPLAIVGVLMRLGRFVQMPLLGLGQGALPLLGYNFGARNRQRVAETVFKLALAGSVWCVLCWFIIMRFPAQVISVFSRDPQFLHAGASAVRWYLLVGCTLALRMLPGFFFQGIGRGLPATVLTATQNIVFLLLPVLLLPRYLGLTGLWLAFPVADLLALAFGQFWMHLELRRQGIRFFWWKTR